MCCSLNKTVLYLFFLYDELIFYPNYNTQIIDYVIFYEMIISTIIPEKKF